jgi:hypothetical protein
MRPVEILVERLRPYRITEENDQGVKNCPKDLASDDSFKGAGAFLITRKVNGYSRKLFVIADDARFSETGWEHVSAHIYKGIDRQPETPTWDDMHYLKRVFWSDDEMVVQIHPAQKDYVNFHEHTLHLWRCVDKEFPMPDKAFV